MCNSRHRTCMQIFLYKSLTNSHVITPYIRCQMKRNNDSSDAREISNLIPGLPNEVSTLILQQIPQEVLMRTASVNTLWRRVSLGLVTELRRVPYFTSHLLLPQMYNLRKLRLREHDFIPGSILRSLTSLTSLTAFGTQHLDDTTLGSLTNLKTLVVKQCMNVTGHGLASLKQLSFLVMEEMHTLDFSSDTYLPNLQTLFLIDTTITPSVKNRLRAIAPKIKVLREQQAYGFESTSFPV